jgi:hypothetical protein
LIGIAVFVTACGATQSPGAAGVKLYAAVSAISSQSISVIDSRSHRIERRLPLGVPSSDWKHLYSVVSTTLVDTDPQTGATVATLQLGRAYRLPDAGAGGLPGGLSANGGWLVVESYDAAVNDLPTATHLVLIQTPALKVARRIDLDGFFNFDAVSNDGNRLYLIELLHGNQYYVRLYDVGGAALDPNHVIDKSDGAAAMSGLRLAGVGSRAGAWLFSMYVRDRANPFIHALNLETPFALCLDLPGTGYAEDGSAMQWSLAMSPDGARVYAANLAAGTVAVVDAGGPQILRIAHISLSSLRGSLIRDVQAKEFGGNTALVSPDGRTLVVAGASGVVWIDTDTLAVRARALAGWRIWSVGLSPDGLNLYAVSEGGKIAEIAMGSARVGATFDLTGGQPLALMRVAAA